MNSMKKRAVSFFLAVITAFCPLSCMDAVSVGLLTGNAATILMSENSGGVVDAGNCGEADIYGDFTDNVVWTLYENGKLVISGNGAMADFECSGDYSNVPYARYTLKDDHSIAENTITSVVLEDGVTGIGCNAFRYCKKLTDVSIAESVTRIGEGAFFDCDSLTSIRISEKVTIIGKRAFGGCDSLTGVNVSANNKQYGSDNGVLYNADKTELILYPAGKSEPFCDIAEGTTEICDYAFEGCQSLTSISVPDSVTTIGDYAFCNCAGLTGISIPDKVESIGSHAFGGCVSLEELTIPQGVASLSFAVFNNCSSLKRITLQNGMTQIGEYAFFGCRALESISLPDTVNSIGAFAFQNCTGLTRVQIPDCVSLIGDSAFFGCTGLVSVRLPDCIQSINDSAFAGCESLIDVTIPTGVTDIGWRAFDGCKALTGIVIPDSVKSIGRYAFSNCTSLAGIIVPDSVTSIQPNTFRSCNSLEDVYYTGNEEQWKQLSVADGNDCLKNAAVHFNYTFSHIHTYQIGETVPATCTTDGYTSYVCSVCGDRYHDNLVEAFGHSFVHYVSNGDATCTSDGTKTSKCSRCNAQSTVTDAGTRLGHTFTKYISNGDATCTSDGTKTAKCSRCNARSSVTDAGTRLGHAFTKYVPNGDATCTADGTKTAKCSRCNARNTVPDTGSKLKHKLKNTLAKATTEKDGKIVTSCSSCGKVMKTVTVPKASSIKLSSTACIYNGRTQTPSVTVKDRKGKTLKNGTDYTVKYASERKNTGKYAVKVILTGNYSGVKNLHFTILPGKTSQLTAALTSSTVKLSWKAVTGADGYKITLYSDKNREIRSVYKTETHHTFIRLASGTVYKVKVTAYKTIDGKKSESGKYTLLTTATAPGTPTLKVSAGAKKAVLKWNRQTGASGYVVYMSTARNGKYQKTATIKSGKSTGFTKTGLIKGKTYYFKVRAYSTVAGKTIYGSNSAIKSMKVK